MFCNKCGTQNKEGDRFCINCGNDLQVQQSAPVVDAEPIIDQAPNTPYQQYNQPIYNQPVYNQPESGKGFAVASLVLGIVSFLCCAVIAGPLSIIFGFVAKSKGSRSGMATAGIICGIIALVLWIIGIAFGFMDGFIEGFMEGFDAGYYGYY